MFTLTKNPTFTRTARRPDVLSAVRRAQERLADAAAGLEFEPEEHLYTLHGRPMASVSSIVESFAPFDAMAKAVSCSKNPGHEHFGKDPEEIVAIWEQAGREAAAEGTLVHEFGEACCLYLQDREDEIDGKFRDRITPEGLVALSPKEEAAARWWADNDWSRYAVVAKETRIVNPELGYAGTFDLLLYDTYNLVFAINDYKTNKDLYRWFKEMLAPPLSMIKDNDIGKYTVQQTLYTIALDNIGLPVSSNTLIWLREDGYRLAELPLQYDKVIYYAVKVLKLQNQTNK